MRVLHYRVKGEVKQAYKLQRSDSSRVKVCSSCSSHLLQLPLISKNVVEKVWILHISLSIVNSRQI